MIKKNNKQNHLESNDFIEFRSSLVFGAGTSSLIVLFIPILSLIGLPDADMTLIFTFRLVKDGFDRTLRKLSFCFGGEVDTGEHLTVSISSLSSIVKFGNRTVESLVGLKSIFEKALGGSIIPVRLSEWKSSEHMDNRLFIGGRRESRVKESSGVPEGELVLLLLDGGGISGNGGGISLSSSSSSSRRYCGKLSEDLTSWISKDIIFSGFDVCGCKLYVVPGRGVAWGVETLWSSNGLTVVSDICYRNRVQ